MFLFFSFSISRDSRLNHIYWELFSGVVIGTIEHCSFFSFSFNGARNKYTRRLFVFLSLSLSYRRNGQLFRCYQINRARFLRNKKSNVEHNKLACVHFFHIHLFLHFQIYLFRLLLNHNLIQLRVQRKGKTEWCTVCYERVWSGGKGHNTEIVNIFLMRFVVLLASSLHTVVCWKQIKNVYCHCFNNNKTATKRSKRRIKPPHTRRKP